MGMILDIDDPLWRKLNKFGRQYGDHIDGFTKIQIMVRKTFTVQPGQDYCDFFAEMFDFISNDGLPGRVHAELDYHDHVERTTRKTTVHRVVMHFEDSAAAFAFKMRFG